jgi:hypothetical protein
VNQQMRIPFDSQGPAHPFSGQDIGSETDRWSLSIEQKARHCKIENRVKTASAVRKVTFTGASQTYCKSSLANASRDFCSSLKMESLCRRPTSSSVTLTRLWRSLGT